MNIQDLPAQSTFRLVEPIDAVTASPTAILEWKDGTNGPYKQNDNTPGNDTLLTELALTANADNETGMEGMWLTNGALVAGKTRQISYTVTYRGILNSTSATPTASYDRNFKEHKKGAFCTVNETWLVKELKDSFASTTAESTETAGEALDSTAGALSVSLHTDTKYYKYHATNYPNLQGVIEAGNNIAIDGTFTLKNLKGTSVGHTGLTPDTLYYAEETGAITSTASATTKFLGKARTATILDHSVDPGVQSSTDGEITTGTDTTPKLQSAAQIKLGAETHGSDISDLVQKVVWSDLTPQTLSANTVYTFTHNLSVTQSDVEQGRYKFVITGENSGLGIQAGDTHSGTWGTFTGGLRVSHDWNAADPTVNGYVHWQSDTAKIDMAGAIQNARIFIYKMW